MFSSDHFVLSSFAQQMLLKIHLSLPFEDYMEIISRIVNTDNINESKLRLNIMMLVRAIQNSKRSQLDHFLSSKYFTQIISMENKYDIQQL